MMFDTIISSGQVIDGSGKPRFSADIAIKNGRIAAIGKIPPGDGSKVIDARGLIVAPGFIDVHTHYDAQVFWDGTVSPSCYHGVTTIFGGFCGFSIAPLSKEAAPYLLRMLSRVEGMPVASLQQGVPWDWQSFDEYLGKLDGRLGVNAGFMAGHSAIRRVVMGERAVGYQATQEELNAMIDLLAQCLGQGAMGFSSTISPTHNDADGQPVPSRHASRDELIALARVCRDFPGTFLEFLPQLSVNDEMKELMSDLAVAAQRPLNWNAISANRDRAMLENKLSASDVARRNGGEVLALTIPQPVTLRINLHSGFIFDSYPGWDWLFRLPIDQRIEALCNAETRTQLEAGAQSDHPLKISAQWPAYVVETTFCPENKHLEGRTIGDIAADQGTTPFNTLLDLAIAEGLKTSFITSSSGPDEALWDIRAELWKDDRTLIGASDAGAHLDMLDTFAYSTQLLGAGVRERNLISLELAIHLLTQVPATTFGLKERGLIKQGWKADIVVLNPESVGTGPVYMKGDLPGGEMRLYADACGIEHVLVNGVQTIESGHHTGALPGTVLRSGADTYTAAVRAQDRKAQMTAAASM